MAAVTDTNVYEPHQWKHSTIVAGVEWKNPVGTASGTFQLAACRWFYDVSQMGAICTKGVSRAMAGQSRPAHGGDPRRHGELRGVAESRRGSLSGGRAAQAQGPRSHGHHQCRRAQRRRVRRSRGETGRLARRHAGDQRQLPQRQSRRHERRNRPGGAAPPDRPPAQDHLKADDRETVAQRHRHHDDRTGRGGCRRRRAESHQHAGRHAHRHPHRRTDPLEPHGRRVRPGDLPDRAELRVARASGAAPPIIGIGGMDSGEKALEYLYAGANAVEVGAAALS